MQLSTYKISAATLQVVFSLRALGTPLRVIAESLNKLRWHRGKIVGDIPQVCNLYKALDSRFPSEGGGVDPHPTSGKASDFLYENREQLGIGDHYFINAGDSVSIAKEIQAANMEVSCFRTLQQQPRAQPSVFACVQLLDARVCLFS